MSKEGEERKDNRGGERKSEREREGGRKKKTPYKISLHFIMERHKRLQSIDFSR